MPAANNSLPIMAGAAHKETFVHLINFVLGDSDEHLIRHCGKP